MTIFSALSKFRRRRASSIGQNGQLHAKAQLLIQVLACLIYTTVDTDKIQISSNYSSLISSLKLLFFGSIEFPTNCFHNTCVCTRCCVFIISARNKNTKFMCGEQAVRILTSMKSVVIFITFVSCCVLWGVESKIYLSCELAQIFAKNEMDRSLIPHCN
jgi:hypothetical protein